MRNNFITACIVLTIMFGSLIALQHRVDNELKEDNKAINILKEEIKDLKKEVFDVKAISLSAISSNELRNAYITIEDNKRFFEYEVKMSRKSIEEFISKLNADMEGLNDMVNTNNSNNQILEEKLNFLLQEIELLQQTQDIIEEPIETPKALDTLRGSMAIESYREEEQCAYELMSGTQNKTSLI